MNPYVQEKTYIQKRFEYKELQKKLKAKKLAKRKENLLNGIFIGASILTLFYLLIVPPLNPFKYEWVRVKIESGDTAYSVQKLHAPHGNLKALLFECTIKNTNSLDSLLPGEEVYVLKEK